jgi:hypothetical protein
MSGSRAFATLMPKLASIIARLETPFENERLACIEAMRRLLSAQQLGFTDLANRLAMPPSKRVANDEGCEPRRSAKRGVRRRPVLNALIAALADILDELSDFARPRELEIAESLLVQARRLGGLTDKELQLAENNLRPGSRPRRGRQGRMTTEGRKHDRLSAVRPLLQVSDADAAAGRREDRGCPALGPADMTVREHGILIAYHRAGRDAARDRRGDARASRGATA